MALCKESLFFTLFRLLGHEIILFCAAVYWNFLWLIWAYLFPRFQATNIKGFPCINNINFQRNSWRRKWNASWLIVENSEIMQPQMNIFNLKWWFFSFPFLYLSVFFLPFFFFLSLCPRTPPTSLDSYTNVFVNLLNVCIAFKSNNSHWYSLDFIQIQRHSYRW